MNIYDQLGVKKYVNALATVTAYGGSIMPPEVLAAMTEASRSFVNIMELQKKAGDCIAKLTNNEAAMISCGAASGMVLAAAVAIAGDDADARMKLPQSDGLKNEILVSRKNRVGYDSAIKSGGGVIVEYGGDEAATEAELEAAITDKTAAIFAFYFEELERFMKGQIPIAAQVKIARRHGIPLIVDAAAQIPVRENLWKFTRDWGADVAIFSGGKGLRGPQASGLVVGKREYIDRMVSYACPNGGVGRPMKVGKEEIIGLMTAVRLYVESDEAATIARYEREVQSVIGAFAGDPAVTACRDFPSEAGQLMPRAKITPRSLKAEPAKIAEWLREAEPGVLVATDAVSLLINPQTMELGELEIVIEQLRKAFDAFRE